MSVIAYFSGLNLTKEGDNGWTGEYVADETEGIVRVEDLPKPKVTARSRNFSQAA